LIVSPASYPGNSSNELQEAVEEIDGVMRSRARFRVVLRRRSGHVLQDQPLHGPVVEVHVGELRDAEVALPADRIIALDARRAGPRLRSSWVGKVAGCSSSCTPRRRRLSTLEDLMPVSIATTRGPGLSGSRMIASDGVTSRARSGPVIGGSAAIRSRASLSA